jgi:hypothetical protein
MTMADVQPHPVEWLWRPWIPRPGLTLLDGDPGLGKSTLLIDLAARVSCGWTMPSGGDPAQVPAGVLLLSAEDDPERTIRPRLDAAGADVSRVHLLAAIRDGDEERPPVLPWDLALVESRIAGRQIVLVIVDPFMAYLDGEIDAHRDQDVRRCLHGLKLLAERTGVAIVIIRHLNKLVGGPALYRGGGSIGITGAVRSALVVGRDPKDPHTCVLAPVKCNLAAKPKALTYGLEPVGDVARVGWGGETDLEADDILVHVGGRRKQTTREQCAQAIRDIVAAGVMESGELDRQLKERGYSGNAIRDGRRLAKVKANRVGYGAEGKWMVSIPQDEPITPADQDEEEFGA